MWIKTIPRFPDYSITRDGQIWSWPRRLADGRYWDGRWLKSILNKRTGYLRVTLRGESELEIVYIHTLVLETYIGPRPDGMECRHLNGNPADNRLENLAWGTPKENAQDRRLHGNVLYGELNGQSKLTEEQVKLIFSAYHDGAYFQYELAEMFGVNKGTIQAIVTKRSWKHVAC